LWEWKDGISKDWVNGRLEEWILPGARSKYGLMIIYINLWKETSGENW
jgi:hypothetical protein